MSRPKVRICFVCLGNICRSPTAEGIMRHLVREAGLSDAIELDSAGTGAWHVGEPPDQRAAATARRRGFPLDGAARKFVPDDFDRFDYVLAMDRSNHANLERLARTEAHRARLSMLRDFDPASEPRSEVPDPYYGGDDGFEKVFDICDAACRGLLAHVREEHGL